MRKGWKREGERGYRGRGREAGGEWGREGVKKRKKRGKMKREREREKESEQ